MKGFIVIPVLCLAAFEVSGASPWDMEKLSAAPRYEITSEQDGVRGIVYEGLTYRGQPADVFAYYSTPGILKGDKSLDRSLPAVVCIHGGGGKAFPEWVKRWAERGYAAISMDLRGYGPDGTRLPNGFAEPDDKKTPYFVCHPEQTEDWFYQAVCSAILAHSMILSFPEVDAERTAVTGISWGGIITTLISGLDHRFKAAVPVYGCGFLLETGVGSMAHQVARQNELSRSRWKNEYEPALYAADVRCPMLLVNGTNDTHFLLVQTMRTAAAIKDASLSIRVGMRHGHGAGWQPEEIYSFTGNRLGMPGTASEITFGAPHTDGKSIKAEISGSPVKAFLNFTTGSDAPEKREWIEKEIAPDMLRQGVPLPDGWTMCFLSAQDAAGARKSTAVVFN